MLLYDSHCHLESISGNPPYTKLALVPGCNLSEISQLVMLRLKHPQYKIGFGIHPWFIDEDRGIEEQMVCLSDAVAEFKPDFIGEIGLDYWKPNHQLQQQLFKQQLLLALQLKLPVVIHSVKAYNDVLFILKECLHDYSVLTDRLKRDFNNKCSTVVAQGRGRLNYGQKNSYTSMMWGIVHGFNSNSIIARQFTELGLLLGIGSIVTKKSKLLLNLERLPLEHMVFESDAPFMPGFGRGQSASSDSFLYAQIVAKQLNVNLIDLINCSNSNVLNLFRK